jgi:branched-subunit amino acid ABC-type transport system permease component
VTLFGLEVTPAALALGLFTGMVYGVLAVGLVLVYRSSRIINFAHGTVGVLSAALLGVLVTGHGVPYWLAFVIAIAVGGAVGGASEVIVVRRLRTAPSLMTVVATLGLAEFLATMAIVVNAGASAGRLYPQPSGFPKFFIG